MITQCLEWFGQLELFGCGLYQCFSHALKACCADRLIPDRPAVISKRWSKLKDGKNRNSHMTGYNITTCYDFVLGKTMTV